MGPSQKDYALAHQQLTRTIGPPSEALVTISALEFPGTQSELDRSSHIGVAIVDQQERYIYINHTLATYHGRKIEEYHRAHISGLIPPNVFPLVAPLYKYVLATRLPVERIDFSAQSPQQLHSTRWRQLLPGGARSSGYRHRAEPSRQTKRRCNRSATFLRTAA